MLRLFEDNLSDSDVEIKTQNEYATKYDSWREKEELNKLKTKYGDNTRLNLENSDDSSSSEDDEDAKLLTKEFERDFFKTLAYLKRKDPKIYDEKTVFFEKTSQEKHENSKGKNKKPMFMKDYERQMILEKGAKFEDSSEDEVEEDLRAQSPTYVEEQKRIKESLKKAVDDDDSDEEKWGGLFQKREKTKQELDKEEEDYNKWLKGNTDHLKNSADESELKSLKDYWQKPDLDSSEAFLRDYLLNKNYLKQDNSDHIPTYEEIIHDSNENLSEDEDNIDKQEEFELKYNFRYEEPDQEFIKRYPRTMEHSVRKTDDRRKIKREEIKKRKEDEKKQKQEELKQLKILKRREIEEKIKKIKEITGNEKMAFEENDIDGDFDPEEHDKRMKELFDNEYYEGQENDEKPEFTDLEEELGPWKDQNEITCEDDDFNMDCDYDPQEDNKKGKKKRNRMKKPKNNETEELPIDDSCQEYVDELYKLDYEDMIGDIPCRFKYREVIPNDFGLSVEEILLARDKELNRWCSLKKTTQYRPEQAEKYDVIAYKRKASNENLKRKYLPSLYNELEENQPNTSEVNMNNVEKSKKNIDNTEIVQNITKSKKKNQLDENLDKTENEIKDSKKMPKGQKTNKTLPNTEEQDSNRKRKLSEREDQNQKSEKKNQLDKTSDTRKNEIKSSKKMSKRQKKNKKLANAEEQVSNRKRKLSEGADQNTSHKKSKKSKNAHNKSKISDARLQAYGINPKKYKNKLKYKNKSI